jgi:hypothetical protein
LIGAFERAVGLARAGAVVTATPGESGSDGGWPATAAGGSVGPGAPGVARTPGDRGDCADADADIDTDAGAGRDLGDAAGVAAGRVVVLPGAGLELLVDPTVTVSGGAAPPASAPLETERVAV